MMKNHWQANIWYLCYWMIIIDFVLFTTFYLIITPLYIFYFLLSSCWWWDWWWIISSKLNRFLSVFILFLFFFFSFSLFFWFFLFPKTQKLFHVLYHIFILKCVIWKLNFSKFLSSQIQKKILDKFLFQLDIFWLKNKIKLL